MKVSELHEKAVAELEEEKIDLAKDVLKERIKEITATEAVLRKLKESYQKIMDKTVDEVVEDIENGNIRF